MKLLVTKKLYDIQGIQHINKRTQIKSIRAGGQSLKYFHQLGLKYNRVNPQNKVEFTVP